MTEQELKAKQEEIAKYRGTIEANGDGTYTIQYGVFFTAKGKEENLDKHIARAKDWSKMYHG